MSHTTVSVASPTPGTPVVRRWILRTTAGVVIMAVLLFWAADTLAWPAAWLYLASMLLLGLVTARLIGPDLLAERMQRHHPNQKPWDRVLLLLYALVNMPLVPLLAALDLRFEWQPAVPLWVQVVAWVLYIAGWGFSFWAMRVNRYFALVVRLQTDRGQTAVTTGPYRFIRHPGYAGGIPPLVMTPLILESWWALPVGVIGAALLVVRTALEDRMLQAELPGYREYAQKVRYRLIPGVW